MATKKRFDPKTHCEVAVCVDNFVHPETGELFSCDRDTIPYDEDDQPVEAVGGQYVLGGQDLVYLTYSDAAASHASLFTDPPPKQEAE